MLIPNHPDDERLSALASRDTDATADAELTAHVSSCTRCTELVDRARCASCLPWPTFPTSPPPGPCGSLPPVEAAPAGAADRLGGWARRFFAPVLASRARRSRWSVSSARRAPSLSGMAQSARRAAGSAVRLPSGDSAASAADSGAPRNRAANAPTNSQRIGRAAAGAVDRIAGGEARDAEDLASLRWTIQTLQARTGSPSRSGSRLGFEDVAIRLSRETARRGRCPLRRRGRSSRRCSALDPRSRSD